VRLLDVDADRRCDRHAAGRALGRRRGARAAVAAAAARARGVACVRALATDLAVDALRAGAVVGGCAGRGCLRRGAAVRRGLRRDRDRAGRRDVPQRVGLGDVVREVEGDRHADRRAAALGVALRRRRRRARLLCLDEHGASHVHAGTAREVGLHGHVADDDGDRRRDGDPAARGAVLRVRRHRVRAVRADGEVRATVERALERSGRALVH